MTTCKDDMLVQVLNARTPCTLRFAADMKARFCLDYTQYSHFNTSDTLLLVSGYAKTFGGGGIFVFDLKKGINRPRKRYSCSKKLHTDSDSHL